MVTAHKQNKIVVIAAIAAIEVEISAEKCWMTTLKKAPKNADKIGSDR